MNKLFVLAVFLVVLCVFAQACKDCAPPPEVPVFCNWYRTECGGDFLDIETGSWRDAGPEFNFSSERAGREYGAWYQQNFDFYRVSYNSGSVLYPSLVAVGLIAALL